MGKSGGLIPYEAVACKVRGAPLGHFQKLINLSLISLGDNAQTGKAVFLYMFAVSGVGYEKGDNDGQSGYDYADNGLLQER